MLFFLVWVVMRRVRTGGEIPAAPAHTGNMINDPRVIRPSQNSRGSRGKGTGSLPPPNPLQTKIFTRYLRMCQRNKP